MRASRAALNDLGLGNGSILLVVPRAPRGSGDPSRLFASTARSDYVSEDLYARTHLEELIGDSVPIDPLTRDLELNLDSAELGVSLSLAARLGSPIPILARITHLTDEEPPRLALEPLGQGLPISSQRELIFGCASHVSQLGPHNLTAVPALGIRMISPADLSHPSILAAFTDIHATLERMVLAAAAGTWAPLDGREAPHPAPATLERCLKVPDLIDQNLNRLTPFGHAVSVLSLGLVQYAPHAWDSINVSDSFIKALGWGRSQSPADRAGFAALESLDQRSYRHVLAALETLGPWLAWVLCPTFQHKGPRDLVRDIIARSLYFHRGAPPVGYTVADPRQNGDERLCLGYERDSLWTINLDFLDDMWLYSSSPISSHRYSRGRYARAPPRRSTTSSVTLTPRGASSQVALTNSPQSSSTPQLDRTWHAGAFARLVPDARSFSSDISALQAELQHEDALESVAAHLNHLGLRQSR